MRKYPSIPPRLSALLAPPGMKTIADVSALRDAGLYPSQVFNLMDNLNNAAAPVFTDTGKNVLMNTILPYASNSGGRGIFRLFRDKFLILGRQFLNGLDPTLPVAATLTTATWPQVNFSPPNGMIVPVDDDTFLFGEGSSSDAGRVIVGDVTPSAKETTPASVAATQNALVNTGNSVRFAGAGSIVNSFAGEPHKDHLFAVAPATARTSSTNPTNIRNAHYLDNAGVLRSILTPSTSLICDDVRPTFNPAYSGKMFFEAFAATGQTRNQVGYVTKEDGFVPFTDFTAFTSQSGISAGSDQWWFVEMAGYLIVFCWYSSTDAGMKVFYINLANHADQGYLGLIQSKACQGLTQDYITFFHAGAEDIIFLQSYLPSGQSGTGKSVLDALSVKFSMASGKPAIVSSARKTLATDLYNTFQWGFICLSKRLRRLFVNRTVNTNVLHYTDLLL